MAMSTAFKTASLLSLGLLAVVGLSIDDVQAGQDGRGGGRGRGRGRVQAPAIDTSIEAELFKICDHDGNQWISFREASHSLLFDRGQFSRVDANTDGKFSRPEFDLYYTETLERTGSFPEPRAHTSERTTPPTGRGEAAPGGPAPKEEINADNVLSLFSEHQARAEGADSAPLPPRIRGPIAHFDRLDVTKDGSITLEDLEWLARPAHLEVRLSSVIAILDSNSDGEVSRAEFDAAMF